VHSSQPGHDIEKQGTNREMPTRDTKIPKWVSYEAILNDVHFEWPVPHVIETKEEAEKTCREYLDRITNGYKLESFYLLKDKAQK
jgi:hypothetical protein